MNVLALFQHVPVAVVVGWVASNLIPYLSALVSRYPGWWTGVVTLTLSFATGFFSDWAAAGAGFAWKAALGASLVSWLIAVVHHNFVLSGTQVEAKVLAFPQERRQVVNPASKQEAA